jgi:hypothetical protein
MSCSSRSRPPRLGWGWLGHDGSGLGLLGCTGQDLVDWGILDQETYDRIRAETLKVVSRWWTVTCSAQTCALPPPRTLQNADSCMSRLSSSSESMIRKRIRIPNAGKIALLTQTYFRTKMGLI